MNRPIRFFATMVASLMVRVAVGQIPCGYEVSAVIQGPPCGINWPSISVGTAISPNGEYVVGYRRCLSFDEVSFVYRTATGQLTWLPNPPGMMYAAARDVNDSGLIVGECGGPGGQFGFVYDLSPGQYTALVPPIDPDGWCVIRAINANGVACGTRSITLSPSVTTAFIWTAKNGVVDLGLHDGQSTSANDLNDATAATINSVDGLQGFVWQDGRLVEIVGPPGSWISLGALNNHRDILGGYTVAIPDPPFQQTTGVLWRDRQMLILEPLPGDVNAIGRSVNDGGIVVGVSHSQFGSAFDRAFIWDDERTRDMNDLIKPGSGLTLRHSVSISDNRKAVVSATTAQLADVVTVLIPVNAQTGDLDANCRVDIDDVLIVIGAWNETDSPADLNGDRLVNMHDLLIVIQNWTF